MLNGSALIVKELAFTIDSWLGIVKGWLPVMEGGSLITDRSITVALSGGMAISPGRGVPPRRKGLADRASLCSQPVDLGRVGRYFRWVGESVKGAPEC